ncbi:MLO-like protein 1 isoform X2 [Prunus avium]|uniref:MLO-like protein n=1 Tax=Prunus avium TaxID=42229 RepID=A0A6P5U1N8_PRUAV|nr:MLO-like protein 1 isoform X2 [Prunus avium]
MLAAVHATFCVLTILFAKAKMSQWKRWEDSIKSDYHPEEVLERKFITIHDLVFIRSRVLGFGRNSDFIVCIFQTILWVCEPSRLFDNATWLCSGWHSYFWIAFIPLILLLAIGTKLEHVITQLANEVAKKHIAIEGDLVVQPSDDQFWFHRPRLILFLIRIILFQNSFRLAYFFWLWYLKKKTHEHVFEALHKIKQELILGIIALLLSVFQDRLGKICITEKQASHWLPCKKRGPLSKGDCSEGKVPLLTATAWQHLQMFIFVLATVHATFSILTILFARARIREWKHWEDSVAENVYYSEEVRRRQSTHAHLFIRGRGGNNPAFLSWLLAFFKQFFRSVTKADYMMAHFSRNSKFNFYNYMIRVLEADFKRVVGISWYLWFYVVISLLLNVWGWHAYFWISFIPLILFLAVGTKLEHVIMQLGHEVAERCNIIEWDLVVQPSDDHFWFQRPDLLLFLIHIILFQNSFQLAFFFWTLFQYKFHSCMMGKVDYIIPRLVIGAFIQFLCSYSTLPLYAIVTQMGAHAKPAIFDEKIGPALAKWVRVAAKRRALREAASGSSQVDPNQASVAVQFAEVRNNESAGEIVPELPPRDEYESFHFEVPFETSPSRSNP